MTQSDAVLAELRSVVRAFVDKAASEASVRISMDSVDGFDRAMWKTMSAQLELTALAIPARFGGAGFGYAAQAVVFEELGRSLACVPFLASVGLAANALLASGDDDACSRLLPGIASGETVATAAFGQLPIRPVISARRHADQWILSGAEAHVLDATVADVILVLADTGAGIDLFAVPTGGRGLAITPIRSSDQTRRVCTLRLDEVAADRIGGAGGGLIAAQRAIELASISLASEQVGGAARTLEMSVEYSLIRMQFGRQIGSFQAIKHKCADMLVLVETARSAVWAAARAADANSRSLPQFASVAKAASSEAYAHCASENVQIHGGIGFTWEHPAHLHVKRARGGHALFGSPRTHHKSLSDWRATATEQVLELADAPVDEADERSSTDAVEAFRREVREWLDVTARPEGLRDYGPTPSASDVPAGRQWQKTLADAGYACLHWPTEYGGRDASVAEQAVFAEEAARAGVPRQFAIVGADLAGPIIIQFGSSEQRAKYLPGIRDGSDMWCQLFSEPDAGSDLAAVRTKARSDGASWIVDGQKIWTSGGVNADYGLLLARTGGSGHGGLSAFVVPMNTAGLTTRPIKQMDGESKFNEVFLTDVRLTADALLGELGDGWRIATATLGRERLSLGSNAVGMFRAIDEVQAAAQAHGLFDDGFADDLTELWIKVWLLRTTWIRAVDQGQTLGSPSFSVLKLLASETYRDIGMLGVEALDLDGLRSEDDEPLVRRMLTGHAQTILGGTSEIQRNVLAERVLGLPRDPARRISD